MDVMVVGDFVVEARTRVGWSRPSAAGARRRQVAVRSSRSTSAARRPIPRAAAESESGRADDWQAFEESDEQRRLWSGLRQRWPRTPASASTSSATGPSSWTREHQTSRGLRSSQRRRGSSDEPDALDRSATSDQQGPDHRSRPQNGEWCRGPGATDRRRALLPRPRPPRRVSGRPPCSSLSWENAPPYPSASASMAAAGIRRAPSRTVASRPTVNSAQASSSVTALNIGVPSDRRLAAGDVLFWFNEEGTPRPSTDG